MKIAQLLEAQQTQQQLDELNWNNVGKSVGNAIGGVAKGVGAVAGGAVGGVARAAQGIKQGYAAGKKAVGGNALKAAYQTTKGVARGEPIDAPNANAPQGEQPQSLVPQVQPNTGNGGQQETPAQIQQAKVGVGQINKIIPKLRTRDLQSVKKNVDATIAKKQKQPAEQPNAGAQQPNTAPQQQAPAAPQKGQTVNLSGTNYQWLGAQWQDTTTGKMAEKGLVNALNKLAAQGAAPKDNTIQFPGGQQQQQQATGTTGESFSNKKKPVVEFYSNFLGRMI